MDNRFLREHGHVKPAVRPESLAAGRRNKLAPAPATEVGASMAPLALPGIPPEATQDVICPSFSGYAVPAAFTGQLYRRRVDQSSAREGTSHPERKYSEVFEH